MSDEKVDALPLRQRLVKFLSEQFPNARLADHQFGADGVLAIVGDVAARVEQDTRQRYEQLAQYAANVMTMLERHPSLVGHLLDTDDNEGQRLRECLDVVGVSASAEVLASMDNLDRFARGENSR